MNILFDHQAFGPRFGGIARYHYELLKGLQKHEHEAYISSIFSENEYLLNDKQFNMLHPLANKRFYGSYQLLELFETINKHFSIRNIKKKQFDIFHPTYYSPYFLKKLNKPFVLTVHDFVHEKYDKTNKDVANKRLLIEKADKIIAISENTKADIIEYYRAPEAKIKVVYHGYHKPNINEYTESEFANYILFVGKRNGYKNFERFIKVISRLLSNYNSLKLICTGNPFNEYEIELIAELNITNQIVQISADENTLNTLYKNAIMLVFPSLYEGFGMPILEAFANNCPICISNTSCFPEIAQNAAEYFDPFSEDSMYEAIHKVLNNENIKAELIRNGQKRLLNFSWEKTTKETIEVYHSLL